MTAAGPRRSGRAPRSDRLRDAPNPRKRAAFRAFRGLRGLLVVAALLMAVPAAAHHEVDPGAPYDFRNSEPSAFASMAMPVYLDAPGGEPVALSVPITLHPEALRTPAFRYLVGFNLHDDATRLSDVALTMDGKPVPFERDVRHSKLQPRYILRGDDLPRDGPAELLLTGTAVASADGQMHVGALAMAFDAGWGTLATRDGGAAQAYTFTLLMSEGHASGGLAPGFRGQGNSAAALVPVAALLGLTLLGLRAALRRLHPPVRVPATRAPAPVPAPAAAPTPAPRPAPPLPASSPWAPPAAEAPPTFVAFPRPRPGLVFSRVVPRPARRPAVFADPTRPGPEAVRPTRPDTRAMPAPVLAAASSRVVARPPRPAAGIVARHPRASSTANSLAFEVVYTAAKRRKRAARR